MEARAVPDIEVPNSAERDAIARRAAIGGDRADGAARRGAGIPRAGTGLSGDALHDELAHAPGVGPPS